MAIAPVERLGHRPGADQSLGVAASFTGFDQTLAFGLTEHVVENEREGTTLNICCVRQYEILACDAASCLR
jgi:hypothetical protein